MLLENIPAAPNAPLEQLGIMDAREQQLVLHTFNRADADVAAGGALESATIHGMLEHWANATPDAPSVVFEVGLWLLCHMCSVLELVIHARLECVADNAMQLCSLPAGCHAELRGAGPARESAGASAD